MSRAETGVARARCESLKGPLEIDVKGGGKPREGSGPLAGDGVPQWLLKRQDSVTFGDGVARKKKNPNISWKRRGALEEVRTLSWLVLSTSNHLTPLPPPSLSSVPLPT